MFRIARTVRRLATRRAAVIVLAGAAVVAVVVPVGLGAQQAAPVNSVEPSISGTPAVDQTLRGKPGTWQNVGSYGYQWLRCAASGSKSDGSDCAEVGKAGAITYSPSAGDVGFRLRFRVTATNNDGSTTAASNATAVVTTAKQGPTNTKPPTISGQTVVDETLTANRGTWTGGITYTYAWQRCDTTGANCATIGSATATTYKLISADAGHTLRIQVTAKNASGSKSATSAQTGVVTNSSPATGCPSGGTGPINVANLQSPARLSIGGQQITPAVVTPGTQVIRVSFKVTACGGRPVQGALVYGTAVPYQQFSTTEQPTGPDGRAMLTMQQLRSFPASSKQQLLVIFARARKSGEDVLGGVSTRRLFSFTVNLRG
jgi:hypothetical protein